MPIGYVVSSSGDVFVQRGERREAVSAGMPVLPGDRVQTIQGFAALVLADASILRLSTDTEIDLLSGAAVRLQSGQVAFAARSVRDDGRTTLEAVHGAEVGATVLIERSADFVVDVDPERAGGTMRVNAIRGRLTVSGENALVLDPPGAAVVAGGKGPLALAHVVPPGADRFDHALQLLVAEYLPEPRTKTVANLPPALRRYALLLADLGEWDRHGRAWAWHPRVDENWRPFQNGRWIDVPTIGWTWESTDAMPAIVHHYGRWGVEHGGRWFWIPGTEWNAAPVAWVSTSQYAGWCPLDTEGRPVYALAEPGTGKRGDAQAARGWTFTTMENLARDPMSSPRVSSLLLTRVDAAVRFNPQPPPRLSTAVALDQTVARNIQQAAVIAEVEMRKVFDRFHAGQYERATAARPPASAPAPPPPLTPAPLAIAPQQMPESSPPAVIYVEPSPSYDRRREDRSYEPRGYRDSGRNNRGNDNYGNNNGRGNSGGSTHAPAPPRTEPTPPPPPTPTPEPDPPAPPPPPPPADPPPPSPPTPAPEPPRTPEPRHEPPPRTPPHADPPPAPTPPPPPPPPPRTPPHEEKEKVQDSDSNKSSDSPPSTPPESGGAVRRRRP